MACLRVRFFHHVCSIYILQTFLILFPKSLSKFSYDLALVYQSKDFEEAEKVLEKDLRTMNDYYLDCHLKFNPNKIEVSAFNLNNRMSNKILNITFNDIQIVHNKNPKYLGVWLDRSLTYKHHLEKKFKKVKSRNNIIQKITGSKWGAKTNVLRTV